MPRFMRAIFHVVIERVCADREFHPYTLPSASITRLRPACVRSCSALQASERNVSSAPLRSDTTASTAASWFFISSGRLGFLAGLLSGIAWRTGRRTRFGLPGARCALAARNDCRLVGFFTVFPFFALSAAARLAFSFL